MKKVIALTLALMLLLTMASCGKKAEETTPVTETVPAPETSAPTEPTETTIPAPTEPEWEPGVIRAGLTEAVYTTFDAGTELNVIGQFLNYYVVEQEDVNLLIHKQMLRLEGEAPFESWAGFTKYGTEVFDNPYLRGEPIATLNTNTEVTVLESNAGWACIEWAEGKGYTAPDMLSKWKLSGSNGNGNNSNANGSTNDGTDVPVGSLTSAEESFQPEIHLLGAYFGPELEAYFAGGKAVVLADGTEAFICLLNRGDEIRVTEHDEKTATIWLEGELFGVVPRSLVNLEGDAAFESWTGYSRHNSVIFGEYQMNTESFRLSTNKEVIVLDEVNGLYVVEYEGQIGYMDPEKVSETKITGGSNTAPGSTWTPPQL